MPKLLSPEEIAARYSQGYRAEPTEQAGALDRIGTAFGDRAVSNLAGIGEAMGLDLGQYRREQQYDNQLATQRYFRDNPNQPRTWDEVQGIGDAARFTGGLFMDSAPELATSLAALPLGAAAGLGALGRTALGAGLNYPAALGDILQGQRDEAGRTSLVPAATLAAPYAAVDMLGLEGALASGRLYRSGIRQLDELQGVRGVAARTGASALRAAPIEAGTEVFQTGMGELGRMAVSRDASPFSDEAMDRYGDAAIGGALMGGAAGGALGGWRRSEGYMPPAPPTVDEGQYDLTQRPRYNLVTQFDPLQARIDQQLGLTRQGAPKDYAKIFEAAASEGSGIRVAGPDGIERELTAQEALELGLPPAAPAAPTAEAAPAEQKPASKVFSEDELFLMDRGVTPRKKGLELLAEARNMGLDLESDALTGFWTSMAENKFGQAKKALAEAVVEQRANNASAQVVPADTTTASTAAQAPGVQANGQAAQAAAAATGAPAATAPGASASGATRIVTPKPGAVNGPEATQTVEAKAQGPQVLPAAGQPAPGAVASAVEAAGVTPVDSGAPVDIVKRRKRVVVPAQPATAYVAPEAPAVGVKTEDRAEIEQMTGNAGDASAFVQEDTGRRSDGADADSTLRTILAARFKGSATADRDIEIATAYLTAMRNAPKGSKVKIQGAIGQKYGVGAQAVRKIGNTSKLVEAGAALGYKEAEVRQLFEVTDNTKGDTPVTPAESDSGEQLTAAMQAAGVDTADGESLGFGYDDARFWAAPETTAEAKAEAVNSIMERQEKLRELISEYEEQGQLDAVEALQDQITALDAQLTAAMDAYRDYLEGKKPATKAAEKPTKKAKATEADPWAGVKRTTKGEVEMVPTAALDGVSQRNKASTKTAEYKALKASIEANGIVDPIVLTLNSMDKPEVFEGNHRLQVARELGIKEIPVVLHDRVNASESVPLAGRKPSSVLPDVEADTRLDREKARDAWDAEASTYDGAPLFDELTPEQQDRWVEYGEGNWEPSDVATELAKIARSSKSSDVETRFSKAQKHSTTGNTVAAVEATMAQKFGANSKKSEHSKHVRVHQTAQEAYKAAGKKVPLNQLTNAQAFVDPTDNSVVHLIADNIPRGHEYAVLLHDVGVHVGLKKRLGAGFKILEGQVRSWANSPASSLERRVYDAAAARVAAGRLEGSVAVGDINEELVAYAAEEAVAAGVKPSLDSNNKLERWLAQLNKLVEQALKNFLRIDAIPALTPQELVNFAHGAASGLITAKRVERGAAADADFVAIARYYASVDRGRELPADAFIEEMEKGGTPGTEKFIWGTGETYAGQTGVRTVAYYTASNADGTSEVDMFVTSDQSRERAKQTGNTDDIPIQTVRATWNGNKSTWSLSIFGPYIGSNTLLELQREGKASTTTDYDGDVWSRLEGVSRKDTIRLLSEARRRLTRMFGYVPSVEWDRVTASGVNTGEGREGFSSAPNNAVRFSKAPTESTIQKNLAKLPKQAQGPARNSLRTMSSWSSKALDRVVFTSDLIDRAVKAGVPAARKFADLIARRSTSAREMERDVERVADMFALVPADAREATNQFLFDSTRAGKWPYGKSADQEFADRYNALPKEARAFVKAVFDHGAKTLALKKQAVLGYTASEYDALIAAAQKTGDLKEAGKLQREKAADIRKYESLFSVREGIPYAPIKRVGDFVVIAKSAEYVAAEQAEDTAQMRKLEADENHYRVTFKDTLYAANQLADQYRANGFASVGASARLKAQEQFFQGSEAMTAVTKLQELAKTKGDAKLQGMVKDILLQTLADNSARKSELRRRNIAGEVDMLQSFAIQGKADAQFRASVQFNQPTSEAMQEMFKQARTAPDRNRANEVVDELNDRYQSSLQFEPQPWLNKLNRLTSIYFLATSPAYYLQNMTQPWMMSLPAMAGRFDYTKAAAMLGQSYGELKDVMKSAKLFEQGFDFSKVPADVRGAINELANRGRIDIGLDTELGEFQIAETGKVTGAWNKIDKGMRMLVQKGEAINRLTTAMTAYRLAKQAGESDAGAIDYAERILSETHGDYGSFNAPKYFNTSLGKIALQFRKFQLIQISFYAKLIRDAYEGNDRKAALKTLAYALGHTGLLAGAVGMPGYAAIAWVLGKALGDEDEPYDLTFQIRKAIGNEDVANLVLRGAPTLAGMDISGKVGAGNMLSIMPFSNADMSTPQGRAEALGTLLGGASMGLANRLVDGLGLMLEGQWLRGLEYALPKGLGDAIKAARINEEGMTRRNGDVILPANEVSAVESIIQAIGFLPADQSVVYERRQRSYEMDNRMQQRSKTIKQEYTKAVKERDTEAMQQARREWQQLQETRKRNGYTVQPMSELLKAPQDQAKREKNTVGGVQFNRNTEGFARQNAGL